MCISPKLKLNPKYCVTAKNGGNPPPLLDERVKYVPIACGVCYECRKAKSNNWKVRLYEEIKNEELEWSFITFTFNEQWLRYYRDELLKNYIDTNTGEINPEFAHMTIEEATSDNMVATIGMRRFLERWRKHTGKSVKHWFITEKGHNGTKRIHLHGIIKSRDFDFIRSCWKHGWIYPSSWKHIQNNYVNTKSINYIAKYVTKVDKVNIGFFGKVLCSPGIGRAFVNSRQFENHLFREKDTQDFYVNSRGGKMSMPIYYRNYLYTESERETLWIYKIDEKIRYIFGEKIDISTPEGMKNYYETLLYYRQKNKELGYITIEDWDFDTYFNRCLKINESFY